MTDQDVIVISGTDLVVSVADEINQEHELFTTSMRTSLDHAIRCGQLLIEQKERLEHGEWLPWVMENCAFSERHAQRYMELALNTTRVSDLPDLPVYPSYQTAKQIDQATSIRGALKILASDKKASKPQPTPEPEKVTFSWTNEGNVQAMLDGMRSMQAGVSMLIKADRDIGVAKHLLSMMRKFMVALIEKIDAGGGNG